MTTTATLFVNGRTLVIRVPMTFRQCGGRKLVLSPKGSTTWPAPRPRIDNAMGRGLARAFRW